MALVSTILEYARLRPHELAELRRLVAEKPMRVIGYANDLRMGDLDEAVSSRGIDLDKAWDGLSWLLSKMRPPIDVIAGGEPLTDDEWADTLSVFSPDDVAQAARFLTATPFTALAAHYQPAEMLAAGITPLIWDQEDALSYLEDHYIILVDFFQAAAADHEPIGVWPS